MLAKEGLWDGKQRVKDQRMLCWSLPLPGFMTTPSPVTTKISMKEELGRKIKKSVSPLST